MVLPQALTEITRFRHRVAGQATSGPLAGQAAMLEGNYHLLWANDLIDQKREDEGRRHAEAAEQAYLSQPRLGPETYDLGLTYLKLRDRDKASRAFTRYLDFEPSGERADDVRHLLSLLAEE